MSSWDIHRLVVIREWGTLPADRLLTLKHFQMAVWHYRWSVAEWRRQGHEWSGEEAIQFHESVVVPAQLEFQRLRSKLIDSESRWLKLKL